MVRERGGEVIPAHRGSPFAEPPLLKGGMKTWMRRNARSTIEQKVHSPRYGGLGR